MIEDEINRLRLAEGLEPIPYYGEYNPFVPLPPLAMHTVAHARMAVARARQWGTPEQIRKVEARVRERYPELSI